MITSGVCRILIQNTRFTTGVSNDIHLWNWEIVVDLPVISTKILPKIYELILACWNSTRGIYFLLANTSSSNTKYFTFQLILLLILYFCACFCKYACHSVLGTCNIWIHFYKVKMFVPPRSLKKNHCSLPMLIASSFSHHHHKYCCQFLRCLLKCHLISYWSITTKFFTSENFACPSHKFPWT